MDLTFLNPWRTSLHTAAEQAYTLSKQGSDLALSQSKAMEKQFATGLDTWHGMVTAQQQAALAMGRVFVDALKPTSANA